MSKENVFLTEDLYFSKLDISENRPNKSGVLCTVKGPFAEINKKNRNNRVYSKSLWEKAINSEYIKEMLSNRTLFGEADHPESRYEISLPNVSHVIYDVWIDENNELLMGEADILDTPAGRIVDTLVKYGAKIGISARASGSLISEEDYDVVAEDDYNLFTFDFVPNPGFGSSRLDPVNESREHMEKSVKESLKQQIEESNLNDLKIIKTVLESSEDKGFYGSLLERIEERMSPEPEVVKPEPQQKPTQEPTQEKSSKKKKVKKSEPKVDREDTVLLLEKAHRKNFDLEKENSGLKNSIKRLEDKVTGLSSEVADYKRYFDKKEDSFLSLDDMYNSAVQSFRRVNKEKDLLEKRAHEMEESLKELDGMVEYLVENKGSDKEKESQYKGMLEEKEQEISALKSRNTKLSEKNQQVLSSQKKLYEDLENKNKELQEFAISIASGRTGIDEGQIKKFLGEDFSVEDLENFQREHRSKGTGIFSREAVQEPVELESRLEETHNSHLTGLLKRMKK